MIPCLTKTTRRLKDNHAFTLVEMMIAVAFSVLLMTGVFGFYNASSQVYSTGISGQALQDGAHIVLSKIIEGETESSTVYRLSTAVSYMIPNGGTNFLYNCGHGPQATSCNTSNTSSELYYCQDNPCTGSSDATARWYYLDSTGTSIIYHHPVSGGGTIEENIYTAPAGSALKLRFSPAQSNNTTLPNVVEIDVDLTGNLSLQVTNGRMATSGDASTFVFLRNHL